MPRKLKTYVTNLGFFELAIAAPSMKAALAAWGMSHNAFQQGFARETGDPAVIAATTAKPGVVLKRGVGTTGAFKEDAELPTALPNLKPPPMTKPKATPRLRTTNARSEAKENRAAVISFEKARREREKRQAKEDAKLEKQRATRKQAVDVAEAALERGVAAHDRAMAAIEREREALDRKAGKESRRWVSEHKKLLEGVERAGSHRK